MQQTIQDLAVRVKRLERLNRLLALVVVTGTVGSALLGARGASPDEVTMSMDEIRTDLRHDESETGLFILDDAGDTRLGAAQFAHGGGGYALHGPEGRGAAVLYLKGDGSLTLYDADGAVTSCFPEAGR